MKRFFCTECKKMRRVRRMPVIIDSANAEAPANRVGVCNWHAATTRSLSTHKRIVVQKAAR